MNKALLALIIALPLIAAALLSAWKTPAADPPATSSRAHVAFLADDLPEDRAIGTNGHEIAASYVAQHLARLGLTPAGEAS
jgi:hypothetical protein